MSLCLFVFESLKVLQVSNLRRFMRYCEMATEDRSLPSRSRKGFPENQDSAK